MSWEKVSLDSICTMLSGNAWTASKFKDEGIIPIIRIQNLGNNENEKFIWWNEPYDVKFIVKKGDILLSLSGSIKVDIWNDRNALLNQRIVKLTPNKDVNQKWFYWQINNIILDIERMGKWALVNNVSISDLKDLEIPLPPLAIQKRIAEILDAADGLRRKDKLLLKKYNELAQAIFIDTFGDIMENKHNYPLTKFGDVCNELFLGLTSKVDYVVKGGYPLIRTTDINQGELSFKKVKFISEAQHRKLTSRRITKKGDVLISKSGTLGTCAIVDSDEEFSTYESIFTVRANPQKLNNIFLVALIRNPSFQDKLIGGKVGAGVAHLNLNMLRELIFPLPPIELQNKFRNSYTSINSQIKLKEKSFTKSLDLFNALILKAFKGELVL